jgi:hypothetical protein
MRRVKFTSNDWISLLKLFHLVWSCFNFNFECSAPSIEVSDTICSLV